LFKLARALAKNAASNYFTSMEKVMGASGTDGEYYSAKQGDCIDSIAFENGFFWQTIWNRPENADLKQSRGDPNILLPGDQVFIPSLQIKQVNAIDAKKHQFKRLGVPAKLRVKIVKDDKPRCSERYRLTIDGDTKTGQLDSSGVLDVSISPNAKHCTLIVGTDQQRFEFDLGGVDPVDAPSGMQTRLVNLGYDPGDINSPSFFDALKLFQKENNLKITGKIDQATQDAMKSAHGS
jgi:hypothetical protein